MKTNKISDENGAFNNRTLNHLELLEILIKNFKKQNIFYSVLGGFGIDAHLGKLTREHDDLDIAIFKSDKPKLIEIFSGQFTNYRIFKNYSHKISFSKQGMLVDFLLLTNEFGKIKLNFSNEKNISPRNQSFFEEQGKINNLNFNTLQKDFLILVLEKFYENDKDQKTKTDLVKLKRLK